MKYCSVCAREVRLAIPPGDNRERYCCDGCGTIHYQNPNLVLGTIPVWEGRVLLCRRAIEPRYGYWTLPAGFLENHETTGEGAIRETLEEARARVALGPMYTLINVPDFSQVHIIYRATLLDLDFGPGEESLAVELFTEDTIPWDNIAFRTIRLSLEHYFADRRTGQFGFHTADLRPPLPPRKP